VTTPQPPTPSTTSALYRTTWEVDACAVRVLRLARRIHEEIGRIHPDQAYRAGRVTQMAVRVVEGGDR
jgi:hypothetical protein